MLLSSKKKRAINRYSDTDYRSRRLLVVFWACQVTVFLSGIQRTFSGHLIDFVIVCLLGVLLVPVYFWAKSNNPDRGANYLAFLLTLVVLIFMWLYEGPRDEILLVFPAIFTFAVLTGSARIASLLLGIILINIFFMAYLQTKELYSFLPGITNYNSISIITILLTLSCFSVLILARDLKKAFINLSKENKRVLKSQAEIKKLVHYDSLTGLPNRVLAKLSFDIFIERINRQSTKLAVMFVDLDDFKIVNDTLGHSAGDEFIKQIAKRLKDVVRSSDIVCRLGGDEFLIILPDIENDEDPHYIAEKLLTDINTPIDVDGKKISVSCSIGIAVAPTDGMTYEELYMKADMAMYKGKNQGKNEALKFQVEWMDEHTRHLTLVNAINHVISTNELELHFQPLTDLKRNKVIACEALLRWNHPELGNVPPSEFIPIAESTGAILEIGDWVINQACKKLQNLDRQGIHISLAINVSALQFTRGDIVEAVKTSIEHYDIKANRLELEFTESLFVNDLEGVSKKLKKLRKIGVKLSIDDFGTGYSNLSNLQHFDIQTLKIDRSFIKDLTTNKDNRNIVNAIEQMAKSLDLLTVAEGIEDEETSKLVEKIGCSIGQGYYWSKPLPESELDALLKQQSTDTDETNVS
jgi:diguanylate cyclase (GGDEF)-like protein